jgi:phosphatidylserine/phosphatidylglycerophosphate/cardiolipin synthase-like enzyme
MPAARLMILAVFPSGLPKISLPGGKSAASVPLVDGQKNHFRASIAGIKSPQAWERSDRRGSAASARPKTPADIQRKRGDNTASEQLVRRFADRFWKTDWPGSSHPSVFYDPRALDLNSPGGVLHAKAVVADDEVVFVTSANLTEAALDRNIELGVLIRDRAFALTICTYFRHLIDQISFIEEVDSNSRVLRLTSLNELVA